MPYGRSEWLPNYYGCLIVTDLCMKARRFSSPGYFLIDYQIYLIHKVTFDSNGLVLNLDEDITLPIV